jgi:hypothetical protein
VVPGDRRGAIGVAVDHDDAARRKATRLGGQLVEHGADCRFLLVRGNDHDDRRELQLAVPGVELGDGRVVVFVEVGRQQCSLHMGTAAAVAQPVA